MTRETQETRGGGVRGRGQDPDWEWAGTREAGRGCETGSGRGGRSLCGEGLAHAKHKPCGLQSVIKVWAPAYVRPLSVKVTFFQLLIAFRNSSSCLCSVLGLQNFALAHSLAVMFISLCRRRSRIEASLSLGF